MRNATKKRIVVDVNYHQLRELLGLPESVQIYGVRDDVNYVETIRIGIDGIGPETEPGNALRTARLRDGETVMGAIRRELGEVVR